MTPQKMGQWYEWQHKEVSVTLLTADLCRFSGVNYTADLPLCCIENSKPYQ
jgi:hypothetical protein